jgi:xanthine dehydrogenase accessory factor
VILKKIIDAKKYKKEIIKAKIVSAEGSVPRNSGTFMLITSKYLFGSIGGGQLEYVIVDKAKKILLNKLLKKQVVNIPLGPLIGQCCGGYVQVEIEKFNNGCQSLKNEKMNIPKCSNLYIFGAGHIGQELSTRSLDLDFNVHLIDSRNEYLKLQNEDKINQIYVKYPWLLVKNLPIQSYYVILTHRHDFDFKIINEILHLQTFSFIGLIGSKTKMNRFSNRLVKLGHNESIINKIECPIGLKNIASKKPAEIAISIIGRLLEYRSNLSYNTLNDKNILKKINE